MKRFEIRTVEQRTFVGAMCDGCGVQGDYLSLVEVIISVHADEEGGRRDEYDFCDDCLVERAPGLVAAGSRAPLVTGEDLDPEDGPRSWTLKMGLDHGTESDDDRD